MAALSFAWHVFLGRDAISLSVCIGAATLGSYSLATTICTPTFKMIVHPFVTCSLTNWAACAALGMATGVGGRSVLGTYSRGFGRLLAMLIGPTVVSFSFQLYKYRAMLRRRAVQIVGTAVGSAFSSMLLSALAARFTGLASRDLRLALLSRSFTTPLALEICRTLGVQPPALGLLAAFFTALIAFSLGKALLNALNVRDPVARGLALAGAAHSGGLLALAEEPEAFPVAALMVNLSAAAAVCLINVPAVRALLMAIALG
uniref:LrgB-like protein n=1 Tax=Haptolina brevifila TaxID=156173 RepID=A0A7S2BSW4_9EUKA